MWRLIAGAIVGAAALWLASRGTDLAVLGNAIAAADGRWTTVALASVVVTVASGVARWRLLFYPEASARSWLVLAGAYVVGQMLNILLPLRLGEVARAAWVSRAERIPVGRVLGTIAVERLADLVTVGVVAAALLMLATVPSWLLTPGRALIGTAALAGVAMALLAWRGASVAGVGGRLARRLPAFVGVRLERLITDAISGTRILDRWPMTMAAGILSVVVLLLAASTNYLLFLAFGLDVPAAAALILVIALQVGNTLVSVPGNVGVFHYVTVLTLGAYSVEPDAAFAYAVLLHLVALMPKVIAGAGLLAVSRRRAP